MKRETQMNGQKNREVQREAKRRGGEKKNKINLKRRNELDEEETQVR